jgi:hypothetical protein
MVMVMADAFRSVMKPGWALLIRVIVLSPLSSHTSAKEPVGKQFGIEPIQQGSRHIESPPTGNLERYDNRRNDTTNYQSGTYALGDPLRIMRMAGPGL